MAISKSIKVEKGHELEYHEGGPVIFHDADWIAYAVGAVCETTIEEVYNNGKLKFEAKSKEELYKNMKVKNKADMELQLKTNPRWKGVTFKSRLELEPIENCLHSVNATIQRIVDDLGASDQKLFITVGSSNFRNEVATLNKYKANRDGKERPHYYEAIRQHMITYHGAIEATGMEAEDPVVTLHYQAHQEWLKGLTKGIQMGTIDPLNPEDMECPYVMVSVDKDTFQSAGQHYNPKTEVLRWISELGKCELETKYHETKKLKNGNPAVKSRKIRFDGLKGLYLQMLQGDEIDNIPGIPGYGPVKLFEVMNPLNRERDMYETVLKAWEDYVPDFMADQDLQDEIRKQKWDVQYRDKYQKSEHKKEIAAFLKKAKATRAKEWKEGTMSTNFHYYHWNQFELDEYDTPTIHLLPGKRERMEVEPYDLLQEVATLLWIRHYEIAEGDCVDAPLSKFRHGL